MGISVITGATGHIGYALVLELIAKGERPRLLLYDNPQLFDGMDCEIVMGDITRLDTLLPAMEGAETVYHLAGMVDIGNNPPDVVMRINVDGTQNVVTACKASGVRRLVYCSSVDALPLAPDGETMREIKQFSSGSVTGTYAKSKAIATQAALNSAGPGFDVVVAMPSACIGPYDYTSSFIGEMVRMFVRNNFPVTMHFGSYNFVDIRDVAKGLIACSDPSKAVSGESYILSGEYMKVSEFITLLAELTGHKEPTISLPKTLATATAPVVEQYYKLFNKTPLFTAYSLRKLMENGMFSNEKATRDLEYCPRSTRDSLRDMIKWIQEHEGTVN